tara:strand:+ start:737 stop:1141 length:405 start_codon:yes stop_codon:yes gene_type:complete
MTTRKSKHKSRCNNVNDPSYNSKVYQTIRANDGFENWFMVLLEIMPDVTKLEAHMQEDIYRVQLNAKLNSRIATRGLITIEEYQNQYRIDNKETILARVNKKYDCECGGRYLHKHKSTHAKTKKHQIYISNNNL